MSTRAKLFTILASSALGIAGGTLFGASVLSGDQADFQYTASVAVESQTDQITEEAPVIEQAPEPISQPTIEPAVAVAEPEPVAPEPVQQPSQEELNKAIFEQMVRDYFYTLKTTDTAYLEAQINCVMVTTRNTGYSNLEVLTGPRSILSMLKGFQSDDGGRTFYLRFASNIISDRCPIVNATQEG